MDEPLGLVNGPHTDPAKCPTYYDGCNCTVETLKHNLNCLELVEKERDSLLLQIDALRRAIDGPIRKIAYDVRQGGILGDMLLTEIDKALDTLKQEGEKPCDKCHRAHEKPPYPSCMCECHKKGNP